MSCVSQYFGTDEPERENIRRFLMSFESEKPEDKNICSPSYSFEPERQTINQPLSNFETEKPEKQNIQPMYSCFRPEKPENKTCSS